ncbi:MAG: O-antigen ligase family protein [Bryobacteraceae bacterium]|nr:O-antigen ligase family protein [Bryobacteraceae bacterium]
MGLGTGLGTFLPIIVYVACVAGTVASFLRPELGLYLIALILPLAHARSRLFDYPLGNHVLELIILGMMVGCILTGKPLLPQVRFRRTLILIIITSYISLWIGPVLNPIVPWPITMGDSPFGHWILFVRIPILFLLTFSLITTQRQMQILLLCLLVSFLWVGKSFRQNVGHRDTSAGFSDALRRGGGLGFGGSNGMAAYQAQCLMIILGLWGADKRLWLRAALVAAAAMGFYGVIFSYSRGAYVGLVAALLYLGLFKLRWILPLLFLAAMSWQAILPKAVQDRITMTYESDEGELESSAASRLEVWEHALRVSTLDPLLGIGYDSYRYYRQDEVLKDTHNVYLKVFVETGIVGLILLVSFWVRAFFAGQELFRATQDPLLSGLGLGTALMMIVVLLVNMFGDRWTYFELGGMIAIILGMNMRGLAMVAESRQAAAAPLAAQAPVLPQPARAIPTH